MNLDENLIGERIAQTSRGCENGLIACRLAAC
jgi:hypothetical protein